MANFNNLSLTSSGVKALLEAQAGKTLTLSKIGLGSGSTTSGIVSLKALVTPELMIPISETIIDSTEGYMTVVAKMTNENMTEGFYWKETGLFFKDDNDKDILFAYACITDDKYDYIPAFSDQRYVKNIRIANIVTDTDNITVEESEGLMYVDTVTFNAFKDEVVKYNDVVDNLLSESDNLPLSAKQGKVLKESVNQLNSDLGGMKLLYFDWMQLDYGAATYLYGEVSVPESTSVSKIFVSPGTYDTIGTKVTKYSANYLGSHKIGVWAFGSGFASGNIIKIPVMVFA